ncbi:hypothetical protein QJS10_CPB14g00067 [Acorus calamus]|uniref:Poor homologous synapsis 1 PH domain-containing protein n=1 Tax=Acorus calamus TaxID=4465 RepID=A0AAV9DCW2_ACOCL|nr:hypothetical protein QJS10_CPB14g00067 [Acorus calamus]
MAGALNYAPMISSSDSNGLVVGGGGGRGSDDAAVREQWEVEFSRFFPSRRRKTRPSPSSRVEQLGILRRRKTDRNGGSWVSSSCPVNLHLIKRCSGSVPIIVVCCRGRIYVEKFAMRFATSSAAQEFLNTLKESLKDASETEYPANSYSFDHSSQSEHVASTNELQYRYTTVIA